MFGLIKKSTILLSLLTFSINVWGKKGEIVISSAIEVSPRDVITAYDIVEAKRVNSATLEQLKQIAIAGKNTKSISRTDLTKKLRTVNARFFFPTEVKLIRSTQNVSRMELERKIKNRLLAECNQCNFRIIIQSVPQALRSDWELDLNIDLNKKSVMIPAYSLSEPNNKGWITVEIRKYAEVVILNKDIKFGEPITEDKLTKSYRLIDRDGALFDAQQALGMQAVKFLPSGQILTVKDLKKETVLKKGQIVKAILGQSDFEVSVAVQSEEHGAIGDFIKVKNLESNKVFSAKVEDQSRVRIE